MNDFKNLVNLNEIIIQQKERIKSKCEFIKKNLTNQEKSVFNLPHFYENKSVSIDITRQELENLCEEFLTKIENILNALFKDAKKKRIILMINLKLIILY